MAAQAKEQGNQFFKAGSYINALDAYNRAVALEPTEPTYALNRAMCHLKLYQFPNAESDCSVVLKMQPNNTKALFRRSQARRALGRYDEALIDIKSAQMLEPNNTAVITELESLEKEIASNTTTEKKQERKKNTIEKQKQSQSSSTDRTDFLRAAISPDNEKDDGPIMREVSSRRLPTSSFMDAKKQRESRLAEQRSTASFMSAVSAQQQQQQQNLGNSESSSMVVDPPVLKTQRKIDIPMRKTPRTSQEFSLQWNNYRGQGLQEIVNDRWEVLKTISPGLLPRIFESSLEPSIVTEILQVLSKAPSSENQIQVTKMVLHDLPCTDRWGFISMFLSDSEKQALSTVVERDIESVEERREILKNWGV